MCGVIQFFSAKGDKPGNIYHRMKAITLKCAYLAHWT